LLGAVFHSMNGSKCGRGFCVRSATIASESGGTLTASAYNPRSTSAAMTAAISLGARWGNHPAAAL
jgi:hypothetical protein